MASSKRPTTWIDVKTNERPAVAGIKAVGGALGSIATVGAAGVAAIGAAGAGIAALSIRALAAADGIGKLGARVGMTAEQVSGLHFAAERSGASAAGMDKALTALTTRATTAAKSFAQFGINVRNNDDSMKTSRQLLSDVADRIQSASSQSEKMGIAMKLMGNAGRELVPAMEDGAAGLEAMEAEAKRLGLTMDSVEAGGAAVLADRFGILGEQSTQLQRTLGSVLAPVIESIGSGVSDVAGNTINWLKANREWMQSGIVDALVYVGDAVVPAIAVGVGLIAKAWYGWLMAIDVVKLALNRYWQAIAEGIGWLLEKMAGLARFAGQDGLASTLDGLASGAADFGATFKASGDEAAEGLLKTNRALDETEAKIGRYTAKVSEGIRQTAMQAAQLGRDFADGAAGAATGGGSGEATGANKPGKRKASRSTLLADMFAERKRALALEMESIKAQDKALIAQQRATAAELSENWGWAGQTIRGVVGGLGQAITDGITGGGSVTEAIGRMLTSLGTMLIQTALTALAINALGLIPALAPIVGAPGMAAGPAAAALAVGGTMLGIGKAMGGGGGSSTGAVSSGGSGAASRTPSTPLVAPPSLVAPTAGGASVVYVNFNRPVGNERRAARQLQAVLAGV